MDTIQLAIPHKEKVLKPLHPAVPTGEELSSYEVVFIHGRMPLLQPVVLDARRESLVDRRRGI